MVQFMPIHGKINTGGIEFHSSITGGRNNSPPVGIPASDRRFHQCTIGNRLRNGAGIGSCLSSSHIDLNWFAMTFELDSKRFTAEYFDNPNLPKPSLFSERPYGRFGTFFKTKIAGDKPLELKYRVVVSAGDAPAVDAIQKRYDQFLSELKK